MKKIREVLKSKSGQGVPMILAVVLCCLILACVTFEYMRLMIVAQGVRDSVQSAIVDVATENWDEAYAGLRNRYTYSYQLAGSSWSQNVTSGKCVCPPAKCFGRWIQGRTVCKVQRRGFGVSTVRPAPGSGKRSTGAVCAGWHYAAQCHRNNHC